MKNDVLTLAAIVFVLGLLLSSVNVSDMLGYSEQETPVALQQGN